MRTELIVERHTPLPASPEATFAWHARSGALERLVPPWLRLEVLEHAELRNGSQARLRFRLGPLDLHWIAEHQEVEPGGGFSDVQVSGPFDSWLHRQRFEPGPGGSTILHDRIVCELPFGFRVGRRRVARELERLLRYRHAVTAADLALHAGYRGPALHVAVSGASGFIGTLLLPLLTTGGHRVTRLVRHAPGAGEVRWDPAGAGLDPGALSGVDAVVHLAGENIAGRWTAARRRAVLESRGKGTRLLAEAIVRSGGPRVLVSASAIGYYGERGEELLSETSPAGRGFLPEVVQAWEAASEPAEAAGVRVVRLRIGLPLHPAGGVLQRILPPFRLGVGGKLGSGKQWMSWIGADDLLGAFHHALTHAELHGAVNAVAPQPVRNADFTRELGRVLNRPAVLPVPAPALRALFGAMADEAILASARVTPGELQRTGYAFRHAALGAALEHILGRHLPS